jgi:chaperonin GroEL
MEFNNPSEIVKNLSFGVDAREKVMAGVEKLTNAVKSTLGASGKCVIYEDAMGRPGDGTTTATVIAHSLLTLANNKKYAATIRPIKEGILSAKDKVIEYLDKIAIEVKGSMLENVSAISCNNDKALGKIISQAYSKVGKNGVVLMEESETADTHVDFVEGTQIECGLKSPHFMTDKDKRRAVLDNPYVLIVSSPIPNIRKIQNVLEFVIRKKRSLLIVAGVDNNLWRLYLLIK